jgi:CubicO group peptidase (beta-lactamase class C family)
LTSTNRTILALFFILLLCDGCRSRHYGEYPPVSPETLRPLLDSTLDEVCRIYGLPGLAVGVTYGDEIVYAKGFGVQRLGTTTPVTVKSLFHMASVSKPFVAIGILQLVSQGKLELDSPLIAYLPWFTMNDPRYRKVTIKQMLTHTSGFPDVTDYAWDQPQYDDSALVRYIKTDVSSRSLLFDPGKSFAYSNLAYDVLAEVIAHTAGSTFETYMQQHVFDPCSMSATTFLLNGMPPPLVASPHLLDSSCRIAVSGIYPYNRCHAGSSTLHSDIEDMLKWENTMLENGSALLPDNYLNMMESPQYTFDTISYEGLGFFIDDIKGKRLISHSGSDLGFASYFGMIPQDHIGIVFMSNLHRFTPVDNISALIWNTIYGFKNAPLQKPISEVLAPLICKEDFTLVRQKYFELKRDSADAFDFDKNSLYALGLALITANRKDAAIEVLQLNIDSYPSSASSMELLGDTYFSVGRYPEAVASYRKALGINPALTSCRQKLARMGSQ